MAGRCRNIPITLIEGQNALWPSMRRPVGVKWVLLFFLWNAGNGPGEQIVIFWKSSGNVSVVL